MGSSHGCGGFFYKWIDPFISRAYMCIMLRIFYLIYFVITLKNVSNLYLNKVFFIILFKLEYYLKLA